MMVMLVVVMVVMMMVMLVVVVVMVGKMISDVCHCDCNCDQVSAIVMGFREAIKEEEEKEKEHLNDWRWFSSENFPFLKLDAFKHLTLFTFLFCAQNNWEAGGSKCALHHLSGGQVRLTGQDLVRN